MAIKKYFIDYVDATGEDMREFLFTMGCFPGEEITIISRISSNFIINIKDARYSIDKDLASSIFVKDPDSIKVIS